VPPNQGNTSCTLWTQHVTLTTFSSWGGSQYRFHYKLATVDSVGIHWVLGNCQLFDYNGILPPLQNGHLQKCKSTIGCAACTCAHARLIASFRWTPAQPAAYSHLLSIHRDVCMGLWKYIQLPARDGPILVFSACCYTATVHTIAASLHGSLLAIDSLLERAAIWEE